MENLSEEELINLYNKLTSFIESLSLGKEDVESKESEEEK